MPVHVNIDIRKNGKAKDLEKSSVHPSVDKEGESERGKERERERKSERRRRSKKKNVGSVEPVRS